MNQLSFLILIPLILGFFLVSFKTKSHLARNISVFASLLTLLQAISLAIRPSRSKAGQPDCISARRPSGHT